MKEVCQYKDKKGWGAQIVRSAVVASTLMVSQMGHSQSHPDFRISRVSAIGSGCREGTVRAQVSPGGEQLSILFDEFVVQSGGARARVDSKTCVINIGLEIPAGWSIGLMGADYRGFAGLAAGTIGQHEVLYSLNKDYAGSSFKSFVLRGPVYDNYLHHTELAVESVNWSQCSMPTTLTVRTTVQAQVADGYPSNRAEAMMTLDTADAAIAQTFSVGWRPCRGDGGFRPPPGRDDGGRPGPFPDPGNGRGGRPGPFPDPGNGRGGRPIPSPGPGDSDFISIYQFFNGTDYLYTSDPRLSERGQGWINQGIAFKTFRSTRGFNLIQCRDFQNRYFLGKDSCGRGQEISRLGMMSAYGGDDQIAELYEMVSSAGVLYYTTNPQEQPGFRLSRSLGFVLRSR